MADFGCIFDVLVPSATAMRLTQRIPPVGDERAVPPAGDLKQPDNPLQ
jgi:hypothetical protein